MVHAKQVMLFAAALVVVGIIVGAVVGYRNSRSGSSGSSVVQEFSAHGSITGSTLDGTPPDYGDGTFAVYFKRDDKTKVITLEMDVRAKTAAGGIVYASVRDKQFSLWTTEAVTKEPYAGLESVSGFNLLDCDNTMLDQAAWSDEYKVSKSGNILEVDLGSGGKVVFDLDPNTQMPVSVTWGAVTASLESFVQDDSLSGTLGLAVPVAYPCLSEIKDFLSDVSAVGETTEADATAAILDITRRLQENPVDEEEARRLGARSLDYQLLLNSIESYYTNSCGKGWYHWFSVVKDNNYAAVCWDGRDQCSLAVRGSDDFDDWYKNIVGNLKSVYNSFVGGNTPDGFLGMYTTLKMSPTWDTLLWAKSSQYCGNGKKLLVTGHSLGGAIAELFAMEHGLGDNLVTFASPRVGGGTPNKMCNGRRYYLGSDWGSDPVPFLPPWSSHTMSGYNLYGGLSWFSKKYSLTERGCGDQGGSGINAFQHSSLQYQYYMQQLGQGF